ncbi:hypothetical protein LJC44_03650 [Parabacteroides sp. OttesenSCG-928-G06]|nr:hypothetical protein [Parabacteroides sp. OttesenSCG-928-K15]MDL2282197.1 hypothetical protein [Parabacteroides sp. OttesenSCG-928-G06]
MITLKKCFILLFVILFHLDGIATISVPKSIDLREDGPLQRRDLSTIGSRIIINPYDFNTRAEENSPANYSNKPTLPLNIAYLSTINTFKGNQYGRQIQDLLFLMEKTPAGNQEAVSYTTSWSPHALFFTGKYDSALEIKGKDFFYDDKTLLRTIDFNKKADYTIAGVIPGKLRVDKHTILIEHPNFNYAIQFNKKPADISYYANEEDLKSGLNTLSSAEGAAFWAATIRQAEHITLSVSCALKEVPFPTLRTAAVKALVGNNPAKSLKAREAEWDIFLANLPHPHDFTLHTIDSKGVTSEQVRLMYYKAWVFLAQSVLTPDPEHYPYFQIVTGKPSLWDQAHENSPFSAAWESFVGMQLYGYIDPQISWSALKGMLSLVDESGMLGGESLPSKKAETAWILYQLSEDKNALREVYPALTRYLNWRITQPRWIYRNQTPENEKDAEFVVEALTDIKYMSSIATALGLDADAGIWKNKYEQLYRDYLGWFWKTPQSLPVQHVNQYKKRDTNVIQITTGLFVEELSGDYYDSMLGLFYKHYDTDKPFAGFTAAKYPDVSYTVYGLIEKNKTELACGLLEANIRDIIISNVFAETYLIKDSIGVPSGVRPSIFGMASIIDFVLLKNNYFYARGIPSAVNLFENASGVENLLVNNKRLNIIHLHGGNQLKLSGTYMPWEQSVTVLQSEITPIVLP